jgi:hypothetical protein
MASRRQTLLELALVGLALAAAIAPLPPALVERWFSTGVYPIVQRIVTPASNLVPFAVLDVVSVAALAGVVWLVVGAIRQSRASRGIRPLLRAGRRLVAAAAVVYLSFLLLWGFNYRRVDMADRLVVDRAAPVPGAVLQLGLDAAARINALHEEAHGIGWPEETWRHDGLRRAFGDVQARLSDAPPAVPGRLKATLFGPYFRWTSVDGMVNPFGLEVLANPDLLPFERPFVAAHEWAHLAGYADESEANFIGWLTCVRGGVAEQYSGWLYLYWQVSGEVGEADRVSLGQALADGPRGDIEAIIERLRRGQWPWLRTAGWAAYDQYLKANRVDAGVRSYGEVVTLILRARFEDGWTPVRRAGAPSPPPG